MRDWRYGPGSLVRSLALAKLRELRRQGLTLREIGQLYAGPRVPGQQIGSRRIDPGRLLANASGSRTTDDAFLRALDALRDGLSFYDIAGRAVHSNNRWLHLVSRIEGPRPGAEVASFIEELRAAVQRRRLKPGMVVDDVMIRSVGGADGRLRLRGSFVGFDLFGSGPLLLVNLELVAEDYSDLELRRRYSLTRQEIRTARLLAEGASNADVARRLGISDHTARHHTEHVLSKLGVRSRHHVRRRLTD